jgi:hypothetical protein
MPTKSGMPLKKLQFQVAKRISPMKVWHAPAKESRFEFVRSTHAVEELNKRVVEHDNVERKSSSPEKKRRMKQKKGLSVRREGFDLF